MKLSCISNSYQSSRPLGPKALGTLGVIATVASGAIALGIFAYAGVQVCGFLKPYFPLLVSFGVGSLVGSVLLGVTVRFPHHPKLHVNKPEPRPEPPKATRVEFENPVPELALGDQVGFRFYETPELHSTCYVAFRIKHGEAPQYVIPEDPDAFTSHLIRKGLRQIRDSWGEHHQILF